MVLAGPEEAMSQAFQRASPEQPDAVREEPVAETPTLVVTEEQCRQVVGHRPAADVAYQPGVDVYGRKVAPAEVDGGANRIDLPEEFDIAIGVDIQNRRGVDQSGRPFEATLPVGTVTVKGDRFFFNGKEFGSDARLRLEQACRDFMAGKKQGR